MIRKRTVSAIILALLATLLIAGWLWFDWNRLKPPITTLLSERTGRTVEINGDLDVRLSMTPLITVDEIVIGNADWANAPQLFELQRLRFSIRLWDLLKGRIVIPILELQQPVVELEKNADGAVNWNLDGGMSEDTADPYDRESFPLIGKLHIESGKLHFADAAQNFDFTGRLATVRGEGGTDDDSIQLTARGTLQSQPFELELLAGSLVDLRDEDQLYPVALSIKAAKTELSVEGSLDQPLALRGLDLELHAKGQDLSALADFTGMPFPGSPPYSLDGQLTRRGTIWAVEALEGRVGDSDIAGKLSVDTGNERLHIAAELQSDKLDFDDLGPLIGAPPGTGKGETESPEQTAEAKSLRRTGKLIPDKDFDLSAIRKADASIVFRASRIISPALPLQDLSVELELQDGVMTLSPLRFGIADGLLAGDIRLDASGEQIGWHYDLKLDALKIGKLVDTDVVEDMAGGTLGGQIQLDSRGNSMHDTASNSEGRIKLSVAGGRLSNLMIELIGLDVAESLGMLLSDGERSIPFSCAIGDLAINAGKLKSNVLVIDTADTRIDAELAADLETEKFELTVDPSPKDASPLALRSPLHVKGSFREARVRPDMGNLGLRAGAAAILGAVATPAAALLAFIEPGSGEDADCKKLRQDIAADIRDMEGQSDAGH